MARRGAADNLQNVGDRIFGAGHAFLVSWDGEVLTRLFIVHAKGVMIRRK